MLLDGDAPDAVALAAIRDALDRAGLGAKTAVSVEVGTCPWEEVFDDIATTPTTAQEHPALPRS